MCITSSARRLVLVLTIMCGAAVSPAAAQSGEQDSDLVGVKNHILHTRGWGKTRPIAPNTNPDGSDNPEGRAKNRRVEITIAK